MKNFYVDLHIHIGRNKQQQPVKITASKNLTLTHLLEEASDRKGMDMVGVIDCHAPLVLEELEDHIHKGNVTGAGSSYKIFTAASVFEKRLSF